MDYFDDAPTGSGKLFGVLMLVSATTRFNYLLDNITIPFTKDSLPTVPYKNTLSVLTTSFLFQ